AHSSLSLFSRSAFFASGEPWKLKFTSSAKIDIVPARSRFAYATTHFSKADRNASHSAARSGDAVIMTPIAIAKKYCGSAFIRGYPPAFRRKVLYHFYKPTQLSARLFAAKAS